MAGGTWTTQNKVRPGAYINFRADVSTSSSDNVGGVVTLPLPLDFGPAGVTRVTAGTNLLQFGHKLSDAPMLPLREALKNASEVLVYRIGGGSKASATVGGLNVTAQYGGARGNDISVVVEELSAGGFKVDTALAGELVDSQNTADGEDLEANELVVFEAGGELAPGVANLTGGTSGGGNGGSYADYFEAIEVYDYNVMAIPVADESTKALAAGFTRRMREEEGKKVQLVVGGYEDADYEGVINLANGVLLGDVELTAEQATSWYAGAAAQAGVTSSLTYTAYQGATDANPRLSHSEIVDHLRKGNVVFTEKRRQAVVEQDLNSLVTFDATKNQDFRKNRVLRVLDHIANNTKVTFEDNFIGKVNNDQDGRELFKSNRIAYFDNLVALGAIVNFTADDIEVLPGDAKDSIIVNVAVEPVDALEKLYMTVEVN